MAYRTPTPEAKTPVRIFPGFERIERIKKVQAFIELTTGTRPRMDELVMEFVNTGLKEYEARMTDFIIA